MRDFDRGLNERGRRGARLIGQHIRDHGVRWDAVVASPAARVVQTLDEALPGVEAVEMPRTRERSFCCGAGGARMWMEESLGTRIGTARAEEAVATGAGVVATACPYCTVMLTDGVAAAAGAAGPDVDRAAVGVPEVTDIALLLLDRVRASTP